MEFFPITHIMSEMDKPSNPIVYYPALCSPYRFVIRSETPKGGHLEGEAEEIEPVADERVRDLPPGTDGKGMDIDPATLHSIGRDTLGKRNSVPDDLPLSSHK